ncbi:GFA family protein [Rhizobium bangladeshense]|uniref:GFA family protein n=1 Tax=Rhizobium bangladeshense TaxID=1138189 RepID=UPI000A843DE9|nr:GFA family protein [Rhizobium bangladeshense]
MPLRSLRAKTAGDPLMVSLCHCRDCPRRTGAVAGSDAISEKTQVTIEGERMVFVRDAAQGRTVRFHFCPNCGTSLYWEGDFNRTSASWPSAPLRTRPFPRPRFPSSDNSHEWFQLSDDIKHAQRGLVSPDPDDHESDAG